jgi:hypothetical protein
MSCCLALTRKWKLCSNYATLEESEGKLLRDFTCIRHKGFFDNPDLIKEKWFVPKEGGYAHYMHISSWTIRWIESCLSLGIINITKEEIQNLRPEPQLLRTSPKWSYFLLLCARHLEGFHYSWNPRLWEMTVGTLWFWLRRVGAVQITNKDLQTFICVKGSLFEFYKGIELGLKELTEDEWFAFFEDCATNEPQWFQVFIGIPIEEHKKYVRPMDNLNGHLGSFNSPSVAAQTGISNARLTRGVCDLPRYIDWILMKKKLYYQMCKERSSHTSSELIAVTHHPARNWKWTYTDEELRELNERWGKVVYGISSKQDPLDRILQEVRVSLAKP